MSKKLGDKTGFRVVVDAADDIYGRADNVKWAKLMMSRCEEIRADIKRHIDGIGRIDIEFDTAELCEHCGARWTEHSPDYNGGCCDADEAAQDVRRNAVCAKVFGTQTP